MKMFKRFITVVLMIVVIITISICESLPLWATAIGVFGPMAIIWYCKLYESFEDCSFLDD